MWKVRPLYTFEKTRHLKQTSHTLGSRFILCGLLASFTAVYTLVWVLWGQSVVPKLKKGRNDDEKQGP